MARARKRREEWEAEQLTRPERKSYRMVDVSGEPKLEVDRVTWDTWAQVCTGLWGRVVKDHGNGTVTVRVEVEDIERFIATLDYETAQIARAKFDCPAPWKDTAR